MAVVHARRCVNGKPQQFTALCKTQMGVRGAQAISDDALAITCRRCLSAMDKSKREVAR